MNNSNRLVRSYSTTTWILKPESNPVFKGQFAGLRKYRIGDYRVIYALIGSDVLILRIGDQKDVCKKVGI